METIKSERPPLTNSTNTFGKQRNIDSDINEFGRNARSYEIYASDSILNRHIDNIYDLPCDEDNDFSNESLDALTFSYYDNNNLVHTKAKLPSNSCSLTTPSHSVAHSSHASRNSFKTNIFVLSQASEIHDYDLYYSGGGGCGERRSATTDSGSSSTFQRRKTPILYSPLHYHPGSTLSNSNRPNSRNSLNSRLSSSHNSLSIQTSNKADDSIFITQAMSHDALIGREISDFYNVPIDSDIYALPIDVIRPSCRKAMTAQTVVNDSATLQPPQKPTSGSSRNLRGRLKYVRNAKKRKRQQKASGVDGQTGMGASCAPTAGKSTKSRLSGADKRHSVPENAIEPMHMTLDEVVQKFIIKFLSVFKNACAKNRFHSVGKTLLHEPLLQFK